MRTIRGPLRRIPFESRLATRGLRPPQTAINAILLGPDLRRAVAVREYPFGSPAYFAACALRDRFLRQPLGLRLTEADTLGEEGQFHFGVFAEPAGPVADAIAETGADPGEVGENVPGRRESESLLLGSLIGAPLQAEPGAEARIVRLRQVVIDEGARGLGLGRLLLAEAERLLAERGFTESVLWARPAAAAFYEKCGYQLGGETRDLLGLPHERLGKRL